MHLVGAVFTSPKSTVIVTKVQFLLFDPPDDQYRFQTTEEYENSPHISLLALDYMVFQVQTCAEVRVGLFEVPKLMTEGGHEVIIKNTSEFKVSLFANFFFAKFSIMYF